MAFQLRKTASITWPVTVDVPTDGGEFQSFEFAGKFKRLQRPELDAIVEAHRTGVTAEGAIVAEVTADTFLKVMDGWDGIKDADGNALPFDRTTLIAVLKDPDGNCISQGIWRAKNELALGVHRQKN